MAASGGEEQLARRAQGGGASPAASCLCWGVQRMPENRLLALCRKHFGH